MTYMIKHEKISHLSDEQIDELIKRYYSNEKLTSLIKEYNIKISPASKLYTVFPPEICSELICIYCNESMVINRKSKTYYEIPSEKNKSAYCIKCGHSLNTRSCQCIYCEGGRIEEAEKREQERQLIELRKKQKIQEVYDINKYNRIDIKLVSFKNMVYLGTLLRGCLSEDFTTIYSIEDCNKKLTPDIQFVRELLYSLTKENIIIVDPNSSIDAFSESQDVEFPNTYYIFKVRYHLNLQFPENKHELLSQIMNPVEFNIQYKDEALEMWKDIALAECIEYFNFQMNSVKFDFNPGEKTITVFKDLLTKFSVSQIFGIIYKSVAQATKYYQEGNIPKKQAANSVIGNCQRFGERAEIYKWKLNDYYRGKECPQSIISEFFFNRVLKIGDLGFKMPPTIL